LLSLHYATVAAAQSLSQQHA